MSEMTKYKFVKQMWESEFESNEPSTMSTSTIRRQLTCPSRATIIKLINCYDNNKDYVDGRSSNKGTIGISSEVTSRIELKLDQMKVAKQEMTLRPIAREFGVSKSSVARIIKSWKSKKKCKKKNKNNNSNEITYQEL